MSMFGQVGSQRAAEEIIDYIMKGKLRVDLGRDVTDSECEVLELILKQATEIRDAAKKGWY